MVSVSNGSVNRDVETARGQSRCRIIGEQQRARMIDGHAQRLHFTVVQRQESGERQKFRGCRSAGRGVAPRESGLVQGCGAVPLDLTPEGDRYDHPPEVAQQIDASQFIQMNDRTGVAHNRPRRRFSRPHGVPIGHPPSGTRRSDRGREIQGIAEALPPAGRRDRSHSLPQRTRALARPAPPADRPRFGLCPCHQHSTGVTARFPGQEARPRENAVLVSSRPHRRSAAAARVPRSTCCPARGS